MDVEGKVAIITGGGTGVGRATALDLARRGCSVAINYSRSKDEAEATAAEVAQLGVRALPVQADVADDAACRALVDATRARARPRRRAGAERRRHRRSSRTRTSTPSPPTTGSASSAST